MDTVQAAPGDLDIARLLSAAGEKNPIELLLQVRCREIDAHVNAGSKLDAFRAQLFKSPVDHPL
ncbi:MAG TPA: hypothetical protein VJ323_18445, partial [Bryobacteraceae bacterium]|nr:hypothetical protein [Bryobacteraceae bacterium]